jgi:hypothetical protein
MILEAKKLNRLFSSYHLMMMMKILTLVNKLLSVSYMAAVIN